jgi:hypothetical protein
MYRHGGVLCAGLMPMMLVPRIGFHSYFMVCCGMACFASLTTVLIDDSKIDHAAARGSDDRDTVKSGAASNQVTDLVPYSELLSRKNVILAILSVVMFHLANAVMLPMIGQKIEATRDMLMNNSNSSYEWIPGVGEVNGAVGVSIASIVAEVTAMPMAYIAAKYADQTGWGRRWVAVLGFSALPIRGVLLATVDNAFGLFAIQLLDGIGGAVVGVIPILMMQDLTQGTGRFSSMQGGVAAALGLGSAMSQLGGGYLAEVFGFSFMFYVMSGIAVLAVVCVAVMDETKQSDLYSL